jgi:hypothetical protein
MLAGGILVYSGIIARFPEDGTGSGMLRSVFGIVLMLYGVYRLVLTEMQRRTRAREGR